MTHGRKSADVAVVGGVMARQRIYDVLRANARAERFACVSAIATDAKVDESVVHAYIHALHIAGLVETADFFRARQRLAAGGRDGTPRTGWECRYRLVRDLGVEAPRVTRDGLEISGLTTHEAIWRAIRVLRRFSWVDIHAAVSPDEAAVAPAKVKAYLADLHAAGYLKKSTPGRPGVPPMWALRLPRDTGPRAPMVQRAKVVFDPNEGRVVHRWTDAPDEPGAETVEVA